MRFFTYSLTTGEILSNNAVPDSISFADVEIPEGQGKMLGHANGDRKKVDLDSLTLVDRDDIEEYAR
jgi:hypothetical protein